MSGPRSARWFLVAALAFSVAAPLVLGPAIETAEAAQRKRKRKAKAKTRRAKPARRAPPEPAPPPAPVSDVVPQTQFRGPTRIDFDDRLIQGQTNKSGAVYLFDRKETGISSMVKRRRSFRHLTIRTVYDR